MRDDCARIAAPTLVITGDEELDRVVPVAATRTFTSFIKGVHYEQMKGTGHLGLLTQPKKFAHLIGEFVHAHSH
jgi:pimeloyl-ACP methyl ester carboxylesterase